MYLHTLDLRRIPIFEQEHEESENNRKYTSFELYIRTPPPHYLQTSTFDQIQFVFIAMFNGRLNLEH